MIHVIFKSIEKSRISSLALTYSILWRVFCFVYNYQKSCVKVFWGVKFFQLRFKLIHSLTKVKILKNRGRFGKFLWCYGPRLCFFCAAEKPEKPRKMYSTKLFTFSEVSLAFPKHRNNTFEARKIHKNLTKTC